MYTLLKARQDVTAEQFINLIEVMQMNQNNYFTMEQLEKIKAQGELLGPVKG
jgi:hypothetical protein